MKVVVAPCAYKGSYSSVALAEAMAVAVLARAPEAEVIRVPIADGGDGTLDALEACLDCVVHHCEATGPTGAPTRAHWLTASPQGNETAIVELAQASGIALLGDDLAPLDAHTIGAGELLALALGKGLEHLVLTVGGSASTDGGAGILTALGARLYDAGGDIVAPGGRGLRDVSQVDLSGLPADLGQRLCIATDVTNPLLGPSGAARIYGPQKGASDDEVRLLEEGLHHFADALEAQTGRSVRDMPGAGAAGGVPFGLVCATGCAVMPGFSWLSQLLQIEQAIAGADLVISAEGRLDTQSLQGKAIGGLAALCQAAAVPLGVVPGLADPAVDWACHGLFSVREAAPSGSLATLTDVVQCTSALVDEFVHACPSS